MKSICRPGDRVVVPARGGNSDADTPDEKVTVVSDLMNDKVVVRFQANGDLPEEEREVFKGDILVDADHQTVLDTDEDGGDHLIDLTFRSNPAIDPSTLGYRGGLRKEVRLRLDVTALLFEAVSMYPNTGQAITALISNIPKKS